MTGPILYVEEGWPDRPGITPHTRALVQYRAGYYCEWHACRSPGTDVHHRLNRKSGGRYGDMADQVNGPASLLFACRHHHDQVTSAWGRALAEARRRGWLLQEHQHPEDTPVWTRHRPEPVWLLPTGDWWPTTLPHPTRPATALKEIKP